MNDTLEQLKSIIMQKYQQAGLHETSCPNVCIVRRDHPTEFAKCFYKPSCIMVLQGAKHMIYGTDSILYHQGQYVLSCADIPVTAKVDEATPEHPFLAVLMILDPEIIAKVMWKARDSLPEIPQETLAMATTEVDRDILDAFSRLVRNLLSTSTFEQELADLSIYEIYYRILTGPLGSQLQLMHTKGTHSNQISNAIDIIKKRFAELLNMDDIANMVHMAPSSFYRNFKKVTRVSPLQYQKQLKLYEAKRLMLAENMDAGSASYQVGYKSVSQFAREYKKMFGKPPRQDIAKLISVN